MTWVALSTAAMAVLTAFTTLYMGRYSSRVVLFGAQESDQWAFYQAKSIKGHAYEMQRTNMELELETLKGRIPKELAGKFNKTIANYAESITRYDSDKKEIKDKAEAIAKDKQAAQVKAGQFGYALIFLQIALMLSSISVITKKKPLWYCGIAVAGAGIVFFVNGLYLFF